MLIPVVGMDPSLRNWGLAEAHLDLNTGQLTTPFLDIIQPKDPEGKQVRKNSKDMVLAEELATRAIQAAMRAKVIFVEVPVGSQSARAMMSYGTCIGILGTMRSQGLQIVEVSPSENKKHFTGKSTATKREMIDKAYEFYPNANWPWFKGKISDKAEHMADAIAAIHAGVKTPLFQNLMRLFKEV